ncbi:MAG: InlB B-repeat-containing protein [Saccharofermentans sp.]|nr:InlB B-repeat-containing protein [Saccharofermentans sp.]
MLKIKNRHFMLSFIATVITVSLITSIFPFEVVRYSFAADTESRVSELFDDSGSEDLITIEKTYKDEDDKTYKIKAVFGKDAGIPEDAAIKVEEIEDEDYERYLSDAAKAVGEDVSSISYGKLFDISIVKGDDEYQPDGSKVRITIELVDAKKLDDVKVVHFDDKDKAEELPSKTEDKKVTFETEGFSVFSFLDFSTISRKIKAKTVFENDDIIIKGSLPASAIVEAEKVDVKIDGKAAILAYDINIYANADMKDLGIKWQPDGKSLKVTFKSDLITSEAVDVYHLEDEGSRADLVKTNVATDDNSVVFNADSFSIYAIVDHEGGEVKTPRFTIHYLAPVTDASQESVVNGEYQYTVGAYEFVNSAGNKQKTQIVRDGETLEMIANPANISGKYFYGWYVVNLASASGNDYTFTWTASPKHLPFEKPISVTDNGDGSFTMTWTVNGQPYSETADMDPDDYSAHIYVAPIYEDYCFVNFHELAYAVSNTSNLLTRKLVILGSDGTERVLISDVSAQATDTIRRIFRGWQYRTNNTWVSIQTMDDSSNPITKYIDVTENIDLYPYFQEGRWLFFNLGESGNGAKYVPAQFTMAEFDSGEGGASVGGEVNKLPVTSRVGYDFAGWRVDTSDDPDNPNYVLVTDPDGNFLSSVDLSVNGTYEDNDGNTHTGVAYTIKNGVLTIKYPLNSLTFYAQWTEKPDAKVTVAVWRQKVTDAVDIADASKTYDYYKLENLSSTVLCNSGITVEQLMPLLSDYLSLESTADFTGFHLRDNNPVVMNTATVRGDNSTVVNIYFDRMAYNLRFFFARRQLNNGTVTGNINVPYLTGNYNPPNNMTWQAYCTQGSGMGWRSAGTTELSVVCGYSMDNIQQFDYNGNRYYCYVVRANYGQDISAKWPDYARFPSVGGNNLTSWWMMAGAGNYGRPGQNDTVKGKLSTIDEGILGLPDSEDGNFLIASYRTSGPREWTYNIYFEVLDGVDYSGYTTVVQNGKTYYLNDSFMARSGSDNYGQQVAPSYAGFNDPSETHSTLVMNYFYDRIAKALIFDYYYPPEAEMPVTEKTPPALVPYGASLSKYDHNQHPDDTVNAIWPTEDEIPDHYEFGGWYADASCTILFDFNTDMPAADKRVYGKWTPVYYNVCIDPNGGVIDHINYTESSDGGYPTFYLGGFTGANSSDSKWIAAWNANGDAVGSMPLWASTLAGIGSGHNTSQSTYFSAMYGTAVGEYELERTYIEYTGEDDGTKYYYVNMQHNATSGEWGLHSDLRNALYLTADQLEAYYKYCKAARAWHEASRPGYYDGTLPATFDEFKDMYVKKNGVGGYALYEEALNGTYDFVGWFTVDSNGKTSDTPYSFANAIEGDITLRAVWRRVGDYYISYDPSYILTLNDGSEVVINGQISSWTDPENTSQGKYNDGAQTTTLQQPTGITVNGQMAGDDYIFRGWQVVKFEGYDANGHAIYTPLHDVYYAEPTPYTIDAADADPYGCIHMRAVYQSVNESDRRPKVANLMLNANDGYITDGSGTVLSTDADITSATGWTGSGVVVEDVSENEIVFGNMQSNNAVHVYKYAVAPGTLNAPYDASSIYFKHPDGYLLIGFDEGSDYSLDRTGATEDDLLTGDPYIPTYAADSVLSVQRTDEVKLYAVWEPMVYVTFTNRTSQPVTFDLTGSGEAMSIVNEVTGVFSREKFTGTSVTLAPGESIKFVMPEGDGETFTINGTNTNNSQLLNITSWFDESQTVQTTAAAYRSSGAAYELTDTLHSDPEGVHVYFDGIDTIFFDCNGGNWTDTRTGIDYQTVITDDSLVYVDEDGLPYEPVDLSNGNTAKATKPSDPVRSGYTFVGWTTDPDAAACDPAGYTLRGTNAAEGINNMTVIKNSLLWNFNTEVSSGMTLYAVWGETVTVTFHLTNNHTWRDTDNEYFVLGSNYTHTVTLAKGDTVRMPAQPTWNTGNLFYRWVTVTSHQNQAKAIDEITDIYEFGTPVSEDLDLYTSWIQAEHIDITVTKTVVNGDGSPLTSEQTDKEFTFTAEYTTTTYTRSITRNSTNRWTLGSLQSSTSDGETQSFSLKDGETITLPLYFNSSQTITISRNGTYSLSVFFQSLKITEVSDPNYTVTVSINGQPATVTDNGTVTTFGGGTPTLNNATGGTRTYTLSGTAAYSNETEIPVGFTNTRTNTDVALKKIVTPDDYITGNESFAFGITYYDADGNDVTPSRYAGTSVMLKDGETELMRGVPIGGKVTVVETASGWTAESVNDADSNDRSGKTFTLENVLSEGGGITFTNTRDTYDIVVTNSVPGYGSKTKEFTYHATIWNGDTSVPFPSFRESTYSYSNDRKDLTFTLTDGEVYTIKDLPRGYKLTVTQDAEEDYVTTVGLAGETKTEALSYTIGDIEQEDTIEFVNTLKTGSYKITKNVQVAAGQTPPDPGTLFAFTAKILKTASAASGEEISAEIKAMAEALGATVSGDVISFALEDHGEITFSELPVGYFLQVQENAPGFAAYVNTIRTDTTTVPISETGNSDINYINRPASVVLNLKKIDKETGDPVEGAVFRLYNLVGGTQNTLFTLTSGADGMMVYTESGVTSIDISLENGNYYLAEQSAPAGYKTVADIRITVNNALPEDEQIKTSDCDYAELTGSAETKFLLTVSNEKLLVAPTGVAFHMLPFVLIMILGAGLFIGKENDKKKKKDQPVRKIRTPKIRLNP